MLIATLLNAMGLSAVQQPSLALPLSTPACKINTLDFHFRVGLILHRLQRNIVFTPSPLFATERLTAVKGSSFTPRLCRQNRAPATIKQPSHPPEILLSSTIPFSFSVSLLFDDAGMLCIQRVTKANKRVRSPVLRSFCLSEHLSKCSYRLLADINSHHSPHTRTQVRTMVCRILFPMCWKHKLCELYPIANTVQATPNGVEFRYIERREVKKIPRPEAVVAIYNDKKVWARDYGTGGIKYFAEGFTAPIPQGRITSWLPVFQQESPHERRSMIRATLSEYTESHTEDLNSNSNTGNQEPKSDTPSINAPSVYTPETPDQELLDLFLKDKSVPVEAAAILVGCARGRLKHDGVPVPGSVIIESKTESLRTGLHPWRTKPYSNFRTATKSSGGTSKKRKREDASSPAPQESMWEGIWQRLVQMGLPPELQDYRTRLEECWNEAEKRVKRF